MERWWRGGLDATAAATTSVSCSASGSSLKARSCDEPAGSASGSSVTFQDAHHKGQNQDHMIAGQLIESSMQLPTFGLSPSTMDWAHPLLRSSGRAETSYHAMLQDDLSSRPFDSSANPFLLDQHHHLSSGEQGDFGLAPDSYGCSSTIVQGLYESDAKQERSIYNYQPPLIEYRGSTSIDLPPQTPWLKSPEQQSSTNQLQFSNNTSFWNPPAAAASSELGFYPPIHGQFASHIIEQKPSSSNLIAKSNAEGARESATKKKSSSESTFKKPRMETPSPLPSFKVRKEKLGDRITALQQLVSPFGKTDTASVLHEAIEYIKFLHDQVSVLSTPYLKNGNPMQQQQNSGKLKDGEATKQDLRSRGLCLVPIASTYPVASESPADFWTPNFGGTYR